MAPIVEVSGLVRRYGDYTAVDHLDLTVNQGECVAMLGPNGAGKTTTVEILSAFRHRDGGEVAVLGVDPAHATRAWRARIGIVMQTASDLREATVAEALEHFRGYYPDSRSVQDVLVLVGLDEKASSRVKRLSGGQRRRLDVGLGIIGRPELLFLDEPTTGFDPEARQQFWQLIERLKADGTTILLTTHYLEEADALADRVVVIARGRKLADTAPAELGGRDAGTVIVKWWDGEAEREQHTPTPTAFVAELAQRYPGEIPGLEIRRISLEEAYLALVERGSA